MGGRDVDMIGGGGDHLGGLAHPRINRGCWARGREDENEK
jgi:hypothetical protein